MPEAQSSLDAKDAINYALSSMAFLMSLSAFIFTVVFQRNERRRNIRQTLTHTLNEIAGINVELSKLKKEQNQDEANKSSIWKNYNSQRSILIADADFLIHENYKIVTAIDCSLLANTYNAIGYPQKADHFWHESILKSDNNTLKHVNKRDYASFLFQQNHFEKAREQFTSALSIRLTDTDGDLRFIIDTYLIWTELERSFFGPEEKFKTLITSAYEVCEKIKHTGKRAESRSMIDIVAGKSDAKQSDHPEKRSVEIGS